FFDGGREIDLDVLCAGEFQGFIEKSDDGESHYAVLFFKTGVLDERIAWAGQLHVDGDALKVSGVNGGDSLDDKFRRTHFDKGLVDTAKLALGYRLRAPDNDLFISTGQHAILDFQEAREKIERIPGGGKNLVFAESAGFVVQKAENFLKNFFAYIGFDLVDGFLDAGSFDLHHAGAP